MKQKLVMIGNGMAGVNTIEQLIKLNPNKYEITIFGAEPYPNYNRILLSSVLAGDVGMKDITINDWDWYENNQIRLLTGQRVIEIDTKKQTVKSNLGAIVHYDEMIIATGSSPFMLPVPGAEREGVIAFRDIKDCETMIQTSKKYKNAVVIGGGLLGLEAARGLLNLNMNVKVVHLHDYLMERQLDEVAGKMLRSELEAQGMEFLMKKQTEQIIGKSRVSAIRFTDGHTVETDLVVMAVGIKPNVELAKEAGIAVNRGIVVDDDMRTNVPNISAVGECAEHRGIAYGLVAPLWEQGAVLSKRLAGIETAPYEGSILSTKLKISGVDVFSVGDFNEKPGTKTIRVHDEWRGIYKKFMLRENQIVGAVLYGDTSDSSKILQLVKLGSQMTEQLHAQLTGVGASPTGSSLDLVKAMNDEEIICGCNGVSKGVICSAIQNNGLTTVGQIKDCTTASRSCGGCKPLVQQLLELTNGDTGSDLVIKEGICGCTDKTRDEIVEAIRTMHLTTIKETIHVLGWKSEGGCPKCRPALNYFLSMVHPEDYEDHRDSRVANERRHANIQKDGTFSVVPRMYGGVTTPQDLRKIADVAEQFNVPLVKVTGGQRLDLLGVKKEDLPKMWEALDMPSGYAYGKSLRTVKTCVGSTFCRFGTQDAMGMGIKMEKRFERLDTPAKVKMAVSGCPRNCAEATIKDFGVVAIDGGWELHVGGNGGLKVRITDVITRVKTEEEVLEWAGAFVQYYREHANWNERTSEWVGRVGLASIQEALATEEQRHVLNARLDVTLSKVKDPWKADLEKRDELEKRYESIKAQLVGEL